MIRRDYVMRMIEECIRALARIASFKQEQRWDKASEVLDGELQRLIGSDAGAITQLSESDLLVRLMQAGPTHALRDRTLVLTTLLKEAGDVAAGQYRMDESRNCYLKALHLLLDVLSRDEVFECPEFVPKIEMLVATLQSTSLPMRTQAMLMQHYERTGEFAKAENVLFTMHETDPDNRTIVEFGIAFYQRLLVLSDATLNAAGLPRAEVKDGLKQLQARALSPR